ncbi:MAG: glycosyltransferase family 2 protein [Aggregatilineales bacterium]
MPDSTGEAPRASVDVIVPARNEAHTITRVVSSLMGLRYPAFKVTVIDDHSADDTANQARAVGANVIRLETEPPPGWTGKCNACEQGARCASADWLLFTDADTVHRPDSLAQAVSYAEAHQLDALSLLLRQECVGVWDRTVLPLAYQFYFAALRSDQPVFNGQYILIRRAVYEQSGGFGAVRGRVMEDVALAELLARQNYPIALLNGERAASVRMYADLKTLWGGLVKTAFAAVRDRGASGWLLGGLTFAGVSVIVILGYGLLSAQISLLVGGLLIWILNAIWLTPWMRRFNLYPAFGYALLNLPAMLLLWLIGLVSTARALTGVGVRWKDRTIVEVRKRGASKG